MCTYCIRLNRNAQILLLGSYETVSVTSSDEYLSSRNIVLYTPPGFTENPRPVYDVLYMTDLSPDPALVSVVANALDESFVKGETAEAVVLGFGDWLQDDGRDRTNLLTMVTKKSREKSLHSAPSESSDPVDYDRFLGNFSSARRAALKITAAAAFPVVQQRGSP